MSPNAPEQLVEQHVPPARRPQALQGKSRMQQQAARCTGSHCHAPQHDKGPAQHSHPAPPPDVRSAPTAPGTTFLPSCMVPLENWGSGTALSPVGHVGGEVSSHSEEEPWTRTCLPLGPPALHGTFQGQPLSLNPPNYLCSCRLLGEPEGPG
ncbi:uncharacterized protein ACIBXB_000263 [Morphnus guianensis]